jgi:glutathione synthase/RimK-type ligase-like ATP-grasp enzyme
MSEEQKPKILCISTYEKGQAFLREAARLGCAVTLLTVEKLARGDWPWESLDGFDTMPEKLTPQEALVRVTRLVKNHDYQRIIALDEFDLETAALAREHLRLPGMGQTATRYFRDKLAMRGGARRGGVPVPEFFSVANHHELWKFMQRVPGPWLLKPRSSASAIGIQRIEQENEIWPLLERLGDEASHHLLESFVPGDIYHVEGVSWKGEVLFAGAHKYGKPPMQTMHQGGIFTTRTLDREGEEARGLREIHARTLKALGMVDGVTHSEFIRSYADGKFYFLETAARVGGAYIAEVAESASGINPWVEWARIEVALMRGEEYALPPLREEYAGSVICLAKQEEPDTSAYDAAEVVYRLHKHHHAGLIVQSPSAERVQALLEEYGERFLSDFCARMDPPAKPTS